MARLEGETSNAFFETLESWTAYLEAEDIDLPEVEERRFVVGLHDEGYDKNIDTKGR
ncbi:hypothetical protein [Ruegeria sp.]|uniref:hypothetical protein n=1 Tax=Ruegeria sp. TaxID=1879320 RepID=UPI003B00D6E3